jgi:uncharacterized repeat protein (TIGR03803 family)
MRSKDPCGDTKTFFAIFAALLFVSIVPAQSQAQTFKVLHAFHGKDGAIPIGQLVRDAEGNFYGATNNGGAYQCFGTGCGTAFKMNSVGKVLWSYSFDGEDGFELQAGVLRDSKGNIYGTTLLGGIPNCPQQGNYGCGVVFKLDSTGKKETVLHKFTGNCESDHDGYFPASTPVMDAAGNLYATTLEGGPQCVGTVFKISSPGKETILHDFAGSPDGANPYAGLTQRGHNLYGTTGSGGGSNAGTVFGMTTEGNEAPLFSFEGGADGGDPSSVLAFDKAGNLYGTTQSGGNNCGVNGCGTVFELSPGGGGWSEKTLYVFCQLSQCKDGWDPYKGPLVLDKAGNIYGTTSFGGFTNGGLCRSGCGTIFKLDPSGNETVLYRFTGGADGGFPSAGLTMDDRGDLYGTAETGGDLKCTVGGNQGCGVVFELTP